MLARMTGLALALLAGGWTSDTNGVALAETTEVRIVQQFGIGYLPLMVLKTERLMDKHTAAAGLGEVKLSWAQLSGGAVNDALLSGQVDFSAGGVGPMVTAWAKTKGNLDIKAISALNSMPLYLNTTNPAVSSIKDFTEKDKIALPSIKVSIQAVTLQMAAAKVFGADKFDKLDTLTVSMSHPDALAALLSGGTEITGHFTSAPFMYQELANPKVKRVLSSYEVLGGPGTFNLLWTTKAFHDKNPKVTEALFEALGDAMAFIAAQPAKAAAIYIQEDRSKLEPAFIEQIIRDPENRFTQTPENLMKYVEFMASVGSIKQKATDWKELFFPLAHSLAGS